MRLDEIKVGMRVRCRLASGDDIPGTVSRIDTLEDDRVEGAVWVRYDQVEQAEDATAETRPIQGIDLAALARAQRRTRPGVLRAPRSVGREAARIDHTNTRVAQHARSAARRGLARASSHGGRHLAAAARRRDPARRDPRTAASVDGEAKEGIAMSTTPYRASDELAALRTENEVLRKQVERMRAVLDRWFFVPFNGECPACGGTSRKYVYGQQRTYVPAKSGGLFARARPAHFVVTCGACGCVFRESLRGDE